MVCQQPSLFDLPWEDRQSLQAWLAEFDESWEPGRLAKQVRMLPPPGTASRYPGLIELVKIDLEHRWRCGERPRLESYLRLYPELGTPELPPLDLLEWEYQVRQSCGVPASWSELGQRFPRAADDLRRRLDPAPPPPPPRRATRASDGRKRAEAKGAPGCFGRYRILKLLGKGCVGRVYLAEDTQLERRVALKVPHFEADDDSDAVIRFHRAAKAAAGLSHPNICPVYDVGCLHGLHYLTMAYVEGETLAARLADGPPPAREAAGLVYSLALALREAHDRGVLHGNLKPSNVMLNRRGEPVLLDFGLGRRLGAPISRNAALLDTPAYLAPEQVLGSVSAVGPRSDVYSLGVILYELLTGRVPFGGSWGAALARVLVEEPPPPHSLRPGIDPSLEARVCRAMAKEPTWRYASMAAFAADLAAYLQAPEAAGVEAGPRGGEPPPAGLQEVAWAAGMT
jgi:Protein kinase domain